MHGPCISMCCVKMNIDLSASHTTGIFAPKTAEQITVKCDNDRTGNGDLYLRNRADGSQRHNINTHQHKFAPKDRWSPLFHQVVIIKNSGPTFEWHLLLRNYVCQWKTSGISVIDIGIYH